MCCIIDRVSVVICISSSHQSLYVALTEYWMHRVMPNSNSNLVCIALEGSLPPSFSQQSTLYRRGSIDVECVKNRTLTLIEREDDIRSWCNFLIYFLHSITMSCPPMGWRYIFICCYSVKNMLDASLRCQTRCCFRC
jgi:hypothetical protein